MIVSVPKEMARPPQRCTECTLGYPDSMKKQARVTQEHPWRALGTEGFGYGERVLVAAREVI